MNAVGWWLLAGVLVLAICIVTGWMMRWAGYLGTDSAIAAGYEIGRKERDEGGLAWQLGLTLAGVVLWPLVAGAALVMTWSLWRKKPRP